MNVTGTKISTVARRYASWRNDKGEEMPAGETHWLWLSPGESHDPIRIKVTDSDMWHDLCVAAVGECVSVTVDVRPKGSQVQYRALAVDFDAASVA